MSFYQHNELLTCFFKAIHLILDTALAQAQIYASFLNPKENSLFLSHVFYFFILFFFSPTPFLKFASGDPHTFSLHDIHRFHEVIY
jgi:hypothetical protein